jgi:transposase-like protein
MEGYQWQPSKDGQLKDAPVKIDDHYPDALRYAVHTHLKRHVLADIPQEDPDDIFRDVRPVSKW